jgi:hypothetical protein
MGASTVELMRYVHHAQAQTQATTGAGLDIPAESLAELQQVKLVLDPDGRLVGVEPVDYTRPAGG